MKKALFISYLLLFATLLLLPTLQNITNIIPPQNLSGVEEAVPLPEFSINSWIDHTFQKGFELWYSKVYGLRDYFIRTDNQINYTLFNQVNSQIVLGKQKQLFERSYITDYLNWDTVPKNQIKSIAIKLKRLQLYLEEHKVKFIFIITPSKASIYPEYIPEYYLKDINDTDESNYEKIVPFLRQYGVNYLDGQAFCDNLKQRSDFPVFAKGGTHWNYFSALLFTQTMIDKIKSLLKIKMDYFKFINVTVLDNAIGTDADLAGITNMWDNSPFLEKSVFPIVEKVKIPGGKKPKILFVGGSFVFSILDWMNKYEIIDSTSEFYYYFRNKKIADENKELFNQDVIIVEANKSCITCAGFGFLEASLERIERETYKQEIKSSAFPETIQIKQSINVPVTIKNVSSKVWKTNIEDQQISLSYHWIDSSGKKTIHDGQRTSLSSDLNPGESITIMAHILAPEKAGEHTLQMTLVQENVAWFEDKGAKPFELNILVTE